MRGGRILRLVSLFSVLLQEPLVLLTCDADDSGIWRSKADARRGGMGPWHKRARDSARELYERIDFRMFKLEIDDGVRGWRFDDWVEDDE